MVQQLIQQVEVVCLLLYACVMLTYCDQMPKRTEPVFSVGDTTENSYIDEIQIHPHVKPGYIRRIGKKPTFTSIT